MERSQGLIGPLEPPAYSGFGFTEALKVAHQPDLQDFVWPSFKLKDKKSVLKKSGHEDKRVYVQFFQPVLNFLNADTPDACFISL